MRCQRRGCHQGKLANQISGCPPQQPAQILLKEGMQKSLNEYLAECGSHPASDRTVEMSGEKRRQGSSGQTLRCDQQFIHGIGKRPKPQNIKKACNAGFKQRGKTTTQQASSPHKLHHYKAFISVIQFCTDNPAIGTIHNFPFQPTMPELNLVNRLSVTLLALILNLLSVRVHRMKSFHDGRRNLISTDVVGSRDTCKQQQYPQYLTKSVHHLSPSSHLSVQES
jgi:hypothetical protein